MNARGQKVLTFELCRPFLERLVTEMTEVLVEDLEAIALFGSVARDEGQEFSDLDL